MSPAEILAPPSPGTWFPGTAARRPPGTPSLVCLSYAGGTSSVYRDWQERLGGRAHVVPVLLPGRGLRMREDPYTEMAPLAAELADALIEHGHADHYALFGHSMGALLGYEIACALRERGRPEPLHLFVSGSKAPHLYRDLARHALSDGELRRFVHDLGGFGDDGGVGASYFERRLPVLRADLRVCDEYRWAPRPPLRCPMTAFSASDDPIAPGAQVEAWRGYTTGSFLRRHLTGDHFFLNGPARVPLFRALRGELDRLRIGVRAINPPRNAPWTS